MNKISKGVLYSIQIWLIKLSPPPKEMAPEHPRGLKFDTHYTSTLRNTMEISKVKKTKKHAEKIRDQDNRPISSKSLILANFWPFLTQKWSFLLQFFWAVSYYRILNCIFYVLQLICFFFIIIFLDHKCIILHYKS